MRGLRVCDQRFGMIGPDPFVAIAGVKADRTCRCRDFMAVAGGVVVALVDDGVGVHVDHVHLRIFHRPRLHFAFGLADHFHHCRLVHSGPVLERGELVAEEALKIGRIAFEKGLVRLLVHFKKRFFGRCRRYRFCVGVGRVRGVRVRGVCVRCVNVRGRCASDQPRGCQCDKNYADLSSHTLGVSFRFSVEQYPEFVNRHEAGW